MTTPSCTDCKHYRPAYVGRKALSDEEIHRCAFSGKSALWERGLILRAQVSDGRGHKIDDPSPPSNCGYHGKFFEGKSNLAETKASRPL
jgi:hypothetical protein